MYILTIRYLTDTFRNLTLGESVLYTNNIGIGFSWHCLLTHSHLSNICDEDTVVWAVILKDKEVSKLNQQLVSYGRRGLHAAGSEWDEVM